MTSSAHIVVVDDEVIVRETVQDYLMRHGFAVSAVDGGAALDLLMAERAVDLVLLDINMPGEDGLSIARRLRQRGAIGIIMLTANTDSVDTVVGLEIGADDYVAKPFDPRELLARVRAVLRRVTSDAPPAMVGSEVRMGRCMLNLESRRMFDLDGREVPLTAMEFDLLQAFADNPNRVLTRDRLLDLAHHKEFDGYDRSIDVRITRLRRKIEAEPAAPQSIKTVRGAGYIFVPGRAPLDGGLGDAAAIAPAD